jgi:uncharacterized RDD family membrane protein YckC
MQIYLARDNQQAGPYSVEQLNQMLASQQVVLTDLIWHQGMSEWRPLGEVTQGQQHYYPTGYPAPAETLNPFHTSNATSASSTLSATSIPLASFAKRAFAKIIDLLLWLPAFLFPTAFMSAEQQTALTQLQQTHGILLSAEAQAQLIQLIPQSAIIAAIVYILVMLVVQAMLLKKTGQSVGKKVMAIVIVDAESQQLVGINRAFFLRSLLFSILNTFTIPVIFLIDWSFALFGQRRQALHDRLTRTIVVDKK